MALGRICTREVDLAEPGDSVWQAAERMRQRTVGSLLILNVRRQPEGILTDRDLVVRVLAAGKDPQTTTVGEVMTRRLKTIREDASIEVALSEMREGCFRRLPVVDRLGELVGLVTLDDLLLLLTEEMTQIGAVLQSETPAAAALPVAARS